MAGSCKRLICAEDGAPSGDIAAHPRVRRHFRKFRDHPDRASVLARYARRAASWNKKLLKRHTCHVGAWVALLSEHSAADAIGPDNLSPVLLLAQLLKLRGKAPLTAWLRAILALVASRFGDVGKVPGQAADHWSELKRRMPRIRSDPCARAHAEQRPETLKAVREQQKLDLAKRGLQHGEERDLEIRAVRLRGRAALSQDDPEAMVQAVVEGVALLAPPHKVAKNTTGASMTEQAKERLRAASQTRLRAILLRLLGAENGGLDLTDPGTQKLLLVPLERVRCLLRDVNLEDLASAEQWTSFARMLRMTPEGSPTRSEVGENDIDNGELVHTRKRRKVRKVENVGISDLMMRALRELGGQATAQEVREAIRIMPEAQNLSTKISEGAKMQKVPIWENSVVRNMSKLFCVVHDAHGVVLQRSGKKIFQSMNS
eukprot:gnl/TRDRNA2_/TRDRNA2_204175_c0_seq1.p1 gnl/TRDRNA2_/TRDRNA2_204175_c0~~gnl/TRDRNA2_/TRDRNA2_204175_c0_seq1.p1  ORF type:complete len:431 (-),score=65.16 gnl/TRDRNA2_/TRDRNA2_204175_c0_seq1:179-1471(-)